MRLAQTQVWPALRYLEAIEPSTAASRSASSNTMNGALPPSSSERFLIVSADCFMSVRPVSVEPVKEGLRTAGGGDRWPPRARGFPVMGVHTPFGVPGGAPRSAMASAEDGALPPATRTPGRPPAD